VSTANAVASSLRQLYGRSPTDRVHELRAGLREAADLVATLEHHQTARAAEALAQQLEGMRRAASSLAHQLRQSEVAPDAAA